MKNSVTKDFIVYDYLSLDVEPDKEQLYVDCYQNFGWIFTSSSNVLNQDYYINSPSIYEKKLVNLNFKRNRKIKNKKELLTLQKKMELSLKKIDKLTKEPELFATMCSISIGVIGLIFVVFATLSYIASKPLYILCVLNGILGLIGIVLAYFMNSKLLKEKEEKNDLLIEQQYDLIYDYCKKANKLID